MNELRAEGVSKRYGRIVALEDVSFRLAGGECFGLLGRNGAGKTTLLNCMTGLSWPDKGAVLYDGQTLEDGATPIKARLGVLPERDATIPELTGIQYLAFVCLLRELPSPDENEWLRQLTDRLLEPEEALHRRVATYSHGMRIKLGLCAALAADPDFVILDEPFSNLDPVSSALLVDLLGQTRRRGKTLLISSHSLGPVQQLATHIGVLDHGKLLFTGSMAEFTAGDPGALERSLLGLLGVRPRGESQPADGH